MNETDAKLQGQHRASPRSLQDGSKS